MSSKDNNQNNKKTSRENRIYALAAQIYVQRLTHVSVLNDEARAAIWQAETFVDEFEKWGV
jgi:hypothetical protein